MSPHPRLVVAPLLAAGVIAVVAAPLLAVAPAAGAAAPHPAVAAPSTIGGPDTRLSTILAGADVVRTAALALLNGVSVPRLLELALDPTTHLTPDGRLYFVEVPAPDPATLPRIVAGGASYGNLGGSATAADDGVFTLHSLPGAPRTIYLDFTGETVTDTVWNDISDDPRVVVPPYDLDGHPNNTDADEAIVIRSVWKRVAQDYAAMDVDVTTQRPAPGRLTRTDADDEQYGTKVLVSSATDVFDSCYCGGLAAVGGFDMTANHDYYQPAWVFTQGVGELPKDIAESASHEAGHTLGLAHDGTQSNAYYAGKGVWAPIMGVGYYAPLTQWSKGEYAGANNHEDDLAVMASHGATPLPDDVGNTAATAGVFRGQRLRGLISSTGDVDAYTVEHPGGRFSVAVSPSGDSPDLDLRLTVTSAGGAQVAGSRPHTVRIDRDTTTGLDAAVDTTLPAGTYLVHVSGVGQGDVKQSGYSNYASLGSYVLSSPPVR